jgi:hypothetical protein
MLAALLIVAGLIWLGASTSAHAENRDAEVRAFVQAFYTWHVPKLDETSGDPVKRVLKDRPEVLDPALRLALEADERAQDAQGPGGHMAGLDFDPFTSSQDPCPRYDVKEIVAHSGVYRANLYCKGNGEEMPDVIAVIAWRSGRWQFTNFEYPESGNLLEMLKQAAEERN